MFIPNVLYEILTVHRHRTVGDVKAAYGGQHDAAIESYFAEVIARGYAQECTPEEAGRFPALNPHWERPELITNAILDIDPQDPYDLSKAIKELVSVGCKAVQVRIFNEASPAFLGSVLTLFDRTPIEHIELLLKHSPLLEDQALLALCRPFPRVNAITLHSGPETPPTDYNRAGLTVTRVAREIRSSSHCGVINPAFFNVTLENFLESHRFNSCLHKKISIDVHGQVKNCPSMEKSYGHISETRFLDVLDLEGFQDLWTVTKDQVDVCRQCEFRYICTDCRVYTSPEGKPSKCSYDPFTATWA
ncbi:SPASM domain peptide maturase of grasp-with-spasm system [Dinghuibacter silviterrae]|uniref:SPASM domain peptide maturase of grasp-with-spasm system n=2 Tax=Dinghuibacter silviterrae TaxID=1539049 RepID=A0A4R8DIY4_9BACT|nr:SPASM domain peptide maturase of grasp-with-spasm system [Dinghuibacter silviterrae]